MSTVYLIACGGTIAGTASGRTDLTGYAAGSLGIDELLRAIPEVQAYAHIEGEQFCNIDSSDMSEALWLRLAARVTEIASRPDVTGIVITHGTDTLEETAYFLNLTVHTSKPIVLVGSMRPATAISADGPLNLIEAVQLAAQPETGQYGVVVALNGTICSARFVEKTDTTHVDTFKSRQLGVLGFIQDGRPIWYQQPVRRHTVRSELSCAGRTSLPAVDILYTYVGMSPACVTNAVERRVRGIVVAGLGHGRMPGEITEALRLAVAQGILVVRTSRTLGGVVTAVPEYREFISGDNLTPQKAKILLQLALLQTTDPAGIAQVFTQY